MVFTNKEKAIGQLCAWPSWFQVRYLLANAVFPCILCPQTSANQRVDLFLKEMPCPFFLITASNSSVKGPKQFPSPCESRRFHVFVQVYPIAPFVFS